MAEYAYVVQVMSTALRVEVLFNDWLAFRKTVARGSICEAKLNPWMLEGDNRLEVRLGLWPNADPADRLCLVRLYKAEHGKMAVDDDALCFFRWVPGLAPLEDEGLTTVFTHQLTMRKAFGRWGWEGATPYMPKDRPEIEATTVALHQSLARRNITALVDTLRLKHEEMSRALGLSFDDQIAKQEGYLRDFFAATDWHMLPLEADKLIVESGAKGRLVHVYGPDGEEPLVGQGGGEVFALHLTLSRMRGTWEVVR
jgi:hypothetical protein